MIILYTPLPPADVPSAAYAAALLVDIERTIGREVKERMAIAVNSDAHGDQIAISERRGWRVKDYRAISRGRDDVCVYFLASNPYHYYCHEMLATHTCGRCFSVMHDLTAGFLVLEMAKFAGSPFAGLAELAFSEFGPRANSVARDFGWLHRWSQAFVAAQGVAVERSEKILTHSYYVKSRLILEYPAAAAKARDILVCALPPPLFEQREAHGEDGARRRPARFTIGSFGHDSAKERYGPIMRAWDRFLQTEPAGREGRLVIGGVFPQQEREALLALCRAAFLDTVEFPGFLSEPAFRARLEQCDLAIALGFPSCGETSDVVARAIGLKVPIAVSEFAAFREEPAAYRISTDPVDEVSELADAVAKTFALWRRGARAVNTPPQTVFRKRNLAKTLFEASGISVARQV